MVTFFCMASDLRAYDFEDELKRSDSISDSLKVLIEKLIEDKNVDVNDEVEYRARRDSIISMARQYYDVTTAFSKIVVANDITGYLSYVNTLRSLNQDVNPLEISFKDVIIDQINSLLIDDRIVKRERGQFERFIENIIDNPLTDYARRLPIISSVVGVVETLFFVDRRYSDNEDDEDNTLKRLERFRKSMKKYYEYYDDMDRAVLPLKNVTDNIDVSVKNLKIEMFDFLRQEVSVLYSKTRERDKPYIRISNREKKIEDIRSEDIEDGEIDIEKINVEELAIDYYRDNNVEDLLNDYERNLRRGRDDGWIRNALNSDVMLYDRDKHKKIYGFAKKVKKIKDEYIFALEGYTNAISNAIQNAKNNKLTDSGTYKKVLDEINDKNAKIKKKMKSVDKLLKDYGV